MTWSPVTESNRRPSPYHGDALPTELTGPVFSYLTCGFAPSAASLGRAQRWHSDLAELRVLPAYESLAYFCCGRARAWRPCSGGGALVVLRMSRRTRTDESMTTRDDLHHLVDCIDAGELNAAEVALRPYAEHLQPPLPASLGMGHSRRGDLSERADELLTETGFGQ